MEHSEPPHGVWELTILNVSEAGFTDFTQAPDIVQVHYKIFMSWTDMYGVAGLNQKRLTALTEKLADSTPKAMVAFYSEIANRMLPLPSALNPPTSW